jgi:transposase
VAIRIRDLTDEEAATLKRLAHSRTASVRTVERAKMFWWAHEGWTAPAIARELGCTDQTVRNRLKRFTAEGLRALDDAPRSGGPPTYTPEEIGVVVATALTKPATLGLPFGSWTLDRLEAYLTAQKGIGIKRVRIHEVLHAEGLRWRQEETWFGERVDPRFEEKRGRSSPSAPTRRRAASSTSTSWAPKGSRASRDNG